MKRFSFFGLLALFALISCNKDEAVIDNPAKHRAPVQMGEIDEFGNLDKDAAVNMAVLFYEQEYKRANLKVQDVSIIPNGKMEPAFYAINFAEGGFIVISGNAKYVPVIATSENGYFADIIKAGKDVPEALLGYFAEHIILQEAAMNAPLNSAFVYGWERVELFTKLTMRWQEYERWVYERPCPPIIYYAQPNPNPYGVLPMTTNWGRQAPYNDYLGGNTARSTTSATAQLLRVYEKTNAFNWGIMPDVALIGGGAGTVEVAKLYEYAKNNNNIAIDLAVLSAFQNVYGFPEAKLGNYNINRIFEQVAGKGPVYVSGWAKHAAFWLPNFPHLELFMNSDYKYAFVIDDAKLWWTTVKDDCGQASFVFQGANFHINWGDTNIDNLDWHYNGWYLSSYSSNNIELLPDVSAQYGVHFDKRCIYELSK